MQTSVEKHIYVPLLVRHCVTPNGVHKMGPDMSVPYRITVRVTKEIMNRLEELVENYQYETVSDVIRRAIEEFVSKHDKNAATSKVDLVLPKRILQDLEKDLDEGSAISLEDLIRLILRDYTMGRINKELDQISRQEGNK